jgi:hypothetical protein
MNSSSILEEKDSGGRAVLHEHHTRGAESKISSAIAYAETLVLRDKGSCKVHLHVASFGKT